MAAELEHTLSEESVLIQSSGGIFEVKDRGQIIYSKKETNRFPNDGEVTAVIAGMQNGKSVKEAQADAAANVHQPPSFFEWFSKFMDKS